MSPVERAELRGMIADWRLLAVFSENNPGRASAWGEAADDLEEFLCATDN